MVRRVLTLSAVGIGLATLLTACGPAGTVSVDPAENAIDPACASVVLNLPEEMGTGEEPLPKRQTSSQGTGAWGSPAAVVMRCGVPEPGPTTDTCMPVDDVDWINVHTEGDTYTFVTYGRSPAVEVTIDTTQVTGVEALGRVSPALGNTELYATCVGYDEVEQP
ncbi:DUF3515 domain-containing protein [uncultured Agrococcus sp.]|uniref:DUF3515 domain-containing protein n=1 Tax=uncultured Agrococcus sp. TaxID=382258 RepID=UPI0025D664E4|nr:DUF3515 domain-containing protein [uncultured Agrococcus sp.]